MNIRITNKKAKFNYELLEEFIAGIVLKGTEIKSIRMGKCQISDSFCEFINNELFIINMNIEPYIYGSHFNHDNKRQRKILLKRQELKKLFGKFKEKGFSIIPTLLFINQKGLCKIKICLAKGKKLYDKREDIKRREAKIKLDKLKKINY